MQDEPDELQESPLDPPAGAQNAQVAERAQGVARRSQGVSPILIVAFLIGLLGGAAFIYFKFLRPSPELPDLPAESTIAEKAPTSTPAPAPALPELEPPTSLEESDDFLRQAASRLSSNPQLAAWLVPDRLVERVAATVDNVARGESPRTHVPFLAPRNAFAPNPDGPRNTIHPRSYARYDVLTEVFTSLDPEAVAALYRQLEPLFDQSYRQLGYPEGDFDTVLAAAIRQLRATPIVLGEVEIEQKVSTWTFKNPGLERLSPAQKHLLRMGPKNAQRIQEHLAKIADALGLGLEIDAPPDS